MVQIVTGGSDVFDALCYTPSSVRDQSFFAEQVGKTSALLSQAGRQFAESANVLYDRIINSDAVRIAQAALRTVQSIWDCDVIKVLTNVHAIQNAGLAMQRYIMAEPTTRALYHKQGCDGFSDSYVDNEPGKLAEAHSDWRRVMNGVIVETENDGWEAITYIDDDVEEEAPLEILQVADILQTWEHCKKAVIDHKEDHTSKFNAML